jgi:NAD(P)-dependent dehydrogenase (short-subunit alcohol dehydrogenase family)
MEKTYIVTGALEGGIGEAITNMLLSEGFKVIGTYEESLEEKVESFNNENLTLFKVDHSNKESLEKFVNQLSNREINGLINAQMFFNMENPNNIDYNLWEKSMNVNLITPNFLTTKLKSNFLDNSSIVTITSTEGFTGSFGASAYASSKAAIHNLTKTLANNFGSKNIRVNALAAGWIGGVMDTDEIFNMSRKITPLGRLGDPKEIASVVKFLLSEDSSFVNGTTITVDGGYSGVDTISQYEYESSLE